MRNFRNVETIFFDLDGTLSDSKTGIIRCLQYSLGKFNIKEEDMEKLMGYIGPSLSHTYQNCYGLNSEQAAQATAFYRERFEVEGIRENELFAGIFALLKDLRAVGKNIVLATAKPTVHAQQILRRQGIEAYFTAIVGSNLDGTREDKSEVIAYALAEIGELRNSKIVMVGDRRHDILGARENQLPAIAAAYGYGTMAELTEAKPDAIAHTVLELRDILL